MTKQPAAPNLRPADAAEIEQAVAHAIQFDGRKQSGVGRNDGQDHGGALGRAAWPRRVCRDEEAAGAGA